jgi:DNA-binding NarL/FixJ family response regulator
LSVGPESGPTAAWPPGPGFFRGPLVTATVQQTEPVHVQVVTGHELIRAGLIALLEADTERGVVVDSRSTWGGGPGKRDVIVYDLTTFPGDPIEELRRVATSGDLLVVLVHDDQDDVARNARTLGVDAVPLEVTTDKLLGTVERAVQRTRKPSSSRPVTHGLTPRETQIVSRIAQGRTNQEIAQELFLSINSVKTYIRTAYRKMGVTSRSQAVLWAVERQLT